MSKAMVCIEDVRFSDIVTLFRFRHPSNNRKTNGYRETYKVVGIERFTQFVKDESGNYVRELDENNKLRIKEDEFVVLKLKDRRGRTESICHKPGEKVMVLVRSA